MSIVKVTRPWDVSMPKMKLSIDGKIFEIKHNSSCYLELLDGPHFIQVRCGGFVVSQNVNTQGKHQMQIKAVIPNWYYILYLLLLIPTLFLHLLGIISLSLLGVILLTLGFIHLFVYLKNRKKFFRIITT